MQRTEQVIDALLSDGTLKCDMIAWFNNGDSSYQTCKENILLGMIERDLSAKLGTVYWLVDALSKAKEIERYP